MSRATGSARQVGKITMEMKTALLSPKEARWHLPDRDTGLTARPASHPANRRQLDGLSRSALRGGDPRPVRAWGAPKHQPPASPSCANSRPGSAGSAPRSGGAEDSGGFPWESPPIRRCRGEQPLGQGAPRDHEPRNSPGPPCPARPRRLCAARAAGAEEPGGVRRGRSGLAPLGPRGVNGGPAQPSPAHPPPSPPCPPGASPPPREVPGGRAYPPPPQTPGRRHLLPARRSSRGWRDEPAPRGPRVDSPGGCRRPWGGEIQRRERRESRAPRCCCVSAAASSAAGWGRGATAAARPWPRGVAERAGGGRSGRRRGREGAEEGAEEGPEEGPGAPPPPPPRTPRKPRAPPASFLLPRPQPIAARRPPLAPPRRPITAASARRRRPINAAPAPAPSPPSEPPHCPHGAPPRCRPPARGVG